MAGARVHAVDVWDSGWLLHGRMCCRFPETARRLLNLLGAALSERVAAARLARTCEELAAIAAVTSADTIYAVDRVGEAAISEWFSAHWPAAEPVEVVMEGIAEGEVLTFPPGTPVTATKWKVIIDPIDGTRGLMYDKRSAWFLAALAPQLGAATRLSDLVVASMTEIPTSKQWRCDHVGAVRGEGVAAESWDLIRGARTPLALQPSRAKDFHNGFVSVVKFFPEGKALIAQVEEELFRRLGAVGQGEISLVFDDQYLSSGGQLFELMAGRDRMVADLRPLVFRKLGLDSPLACHPYDICTAFLLQELGGVVEQPDGSPLAAPLDTTTPVAWVGYGNETLAAWVRPVLRAVCAEMLGA